MVEVIEIEATHGEHHQVVGRGRAHVVVASNAAATGLVAPAHERSEARHFVLKLAETAKVLDALLGGVDGAVHHRRRRREPLQVRRAHDTQPLVGGRLSRRDDVPHAVNEDLCAAAGDGVKPGRPQPLNRLGQVELRVERDVQHLRRRERVQMDRIPSLDLSKKVLVPVDAKARVVPPLEEQRGPAEVERLLDLPKDHRFR